ncbi:hypothetical protein ACHAWF_016867 [Thalassiosira exigua]
MPNKHPGLRRQYAAAFHSGKSVCRRWFPPQETAEAERRDHPQGLGPHASYDSTSTTQMPLLTRQMRRHSIRGSPFAVASPCGVNEASVSKHRQPLDSRVTPRYEGLGTSKEDGASGSNVPAQCGTCAEAASEIVVVLCPG